MRLALFLILLAGQAQALSCMRPSMVSSFARAAERAEDIYILKGRMTFDEAALPSTDLRNQDKRPAPIPARFDGFGLNKAGFTSPFARPVTLQPICAGPWCGSAVSGQEAILFAIVQGDDLIIEAGPCGGSIFYNPAPELEAAAIACINGRCP